MRTADAPPPAPQRPALSVRQCRGFRGGLGWIGLEWSWSRVIPSGDHGIEDLAGSLFRVSEVLQPQLDNGVASSPRRAVANLTTPFLCHIERVQRWAARGLDVEPPCAL